MKKIILFLLIVVSAESFGQTPIRGKYNYTDSLMFSKYKNNILLDSVLSVNTEGKLFLKKITAPGAAVDTIYRIPGKDSIFYKIGGFTFALKDSTGGGGGATYTASNGVTMVGSDVKLGGALTGNTFLTHDGHFLAIGQNIFAPTYNSLSQADGTNTSGVFQTGSTVNNSVIPNSAAALGYGYISSGALINGTAWRLNSYYPFDNTGSHPQTISDSLTTYIYGDTGSITYAARRNVFTGQETGFNGFVNIKSMTTAEILSIPSYKKTIGMGVYNSERRTWQRWGGTRWEDDGIIYVDNYTAGTDYDKIQSALNFAKDGDKVYLSNRTYTIDHSLSILTNVSIIGLDSTVIKRGNKQVYTLTTGADSLSNTFLLSSTTGLSVGDMVTLCSDTGYLKSLDPLIVDSVFTSGIRVTTPAGKFNDGTFNFPIGTKVVKSINLLSVYAAGETDISNKNVTIKNIIFDGNKDNNNENYRYNINVGITSSNRNRTKIEGCQFINSPTETVIGHNIDLVSNIFKNINGSVFHASIDRQFIDSAKVISVLMGNISDSTNLISTTVSGHSEAIITTSNCGGYMNIIGNRFLNSKTGSVIGSVYASSTPNDWGTNNLIFTGNVVNGAQRLVYLIDTLSGTITNVYIKNNLLKNVGKVNIDRELLLRPGLTIDQYSNGVDSIWKSNDSLYCRINSVRQFIGVTGGGGTSGDSSFVTAEFGTAPTTIGTLVNETFSAGSIPSGWTKGSGITTSYAGAKLNVIGASSIGAPTAGNITTAFTSAMQYDTKRMLYEKVEMVITVVPSTKSANAIIGMCKGVLGLTVYSQEGIYWDLSNGTNSGRVTLGTNTVPTFTTSIDSTSKALFSIGDTLQLYFKRDGFGITAGIYNKTTGIRTITYFNQRWNGSGGRWNFIFMNGTYDVTGIKVSSFERKGGVWFFGDSQTGGYGNSQTSRRFTNLIMSNNDNYFATIGQPSLSAKYADLGGLISEIIADAQPAKAVVALGYNDETETFGANNTKVSVDSIVRPLITSLGAANVGIMGIVPRNATTDIYNDSLSSLATTRGVNFYDIRTVLKDANGKFAGKYSSDGVHVNDNGAIVIANVVIAKAGSLLLASIAADSNYTAKFYNLQSGKTQTVSSLVGVQSDGTAVIIPNNLPLPAGWIQNLYTANGYIPQTAAQPNSMIHTSGYLRTDTAFIGNSVQGLRIGFNNDVSTSTTGANINITNAGTSGNGYPQAFDNITGSGNIKITASSSSKTKGNLIGTISGNNNLFINSHATQTVTGNDNTVLNSYTYNASGNGNIGIGQLSLKDVTTGTFNIDLSTIVDYNGGSPSIGNNTGRILIGTPYDYNGGEVVANGEVVIASYTRSDRIYNFGPKGAFSGTKTVWRPGYQAGTNLAGLPLYIQAMPPTGNGTSGSILFSTFTAGASGATKSTTESIELTIANKGVGIGASAPNASAQLDVNSTTKGFLPPRMTDAQKGAISSPATGLTVFCTDCTATDASTGVMQTYNGTTWKNNW